MSEPNIQSAFSGVNLVGIILTLLVYVNSVLSTYVTTAFSSKPLIEFANYSLNSRNVLPFKEQTCGSGSSPITENLTNVFVREFFVPVSLITH